MLTLNALQKYLVIPLTLKEKKKKHLTPSGSLDPSLKTPVLLYILNYLHKQAHLVSNCHTGPAQPAPCVNCGCQNKLRIPALLCVKD